MGSQIAWILTRDRVASSSTIAVATNDFRANNVDLGSRWFEMTQSDACVNDQSPSCSDDPSNLRPRRVIDIVIGWIAGIFG